MRCASNSRGSLRKQAGTPMSSPSEVQNAIGTWGYIAAMEEVLGQAGKGAFTDIVMVRTHLRSLPCHWP